LKVWLTFITRLAIVLIYSTTVSAHHGTSAYDLSKTITTEATVTTFEWANPHCLLDVDIKDDSGKIKQWTIQTYSILYLGRAGWNRNTLKPGDKVNISFHPAKNGTTFGYIRDGDGKIVVGGQTLKFSDHTETPSGQGQGQQ
jgi:hypothetical protein